MNSKTNAGMQLIWWGRLVISASDDILLYNNTSLQNFWDQADWVRKLFYLDGAAGLENKAKAFTYGASTKTLSRPYYGYAYLHDYNHYHQIQDLAMGSYNGKVFSIRTVTEHGTTDTESFSRIAISCLSTENGCFRQEDSQNQTKLQWNDGTQVTITSKDDGTSMTQGNNNLHDVSVKITGSAPTPTPVPVQSNTVFEAGSKADGGACPDGEEVVIQKFSKLMWIKSPTSTIYSSDSSDGGAAATKAIPSKFCGYTDWRLPTTREMVAWKSSTQIAGRPDKMPVASWLNGNGFSNIRAGKYLSGFFDLSPYLVAVDMVDAEVADETKYDGYIWPVRRIK